MSITRLPSPKAPATERHGPSDIAVILVAHGDRGGEERNHSLLVHADAIRQRKAYRYVGAGVLRGDPLFEEAWVAACQSGAKHVLIYPLFMSDGYFVSKVLPERIRDAGAGLPYSMALPLGLDPALVPLFEERSLSVAQERGINPKESRLLVVGHGSKFGRASALATLRMAEALTSKSAFRQVTAAFLEEPPFFENEIRDASQPTIVTGFFSGTGLHAEGDVPEAMVCASSDSVYTGPIGLHPKIADVILSALVELESKGF